MPLYNFDPTEEGEEDWEVELLEEGMDHRNMHRVGYTNFYIMFI
jgi:hypothetical protein